MDLKQLAGYVLAAQKARNDSWQNDHYTLDHAQAAESILPKGETRHTAFLIGMLNDTSWNDAKVWAEDMIAGNDSFGVVGGPEPVMDIVEDEAPFSAIAGNDSFGVVGGPEPVMDIVEDEAPFSADAVRSDD